MRTPKVQSMQLPRMSDQTRSIWEQLAGKIKGPTLQGVDFLSNLASGDPGQFAQIEAPALRQFGQFQGNMASRFSGIGSGARRSSGFQNLMGGAAGNFAERLQANRMGLQQNAINQLQSLYGSLMQNDPYEQFQYMDEPLKSMASRLGGAGKGALSGAATGASVGSILPGIGTGIGAGIGGLIGGIGGYFS